MEINKFGRDIVNFYNYNINRNSRLEECNGFEGMIIFARFWDQLKLNLPPTIKLTNLDDKEILLSQRIAIVIEFNYNLLFFLSRPFHV